MHRRTIGNEPQAQAGHAACRVRNIAALQRATLPIDRDDDSDSSRPAGLLMRGKAVMLDPSRVEHPRVVVFLREHYAQYEAMRLEDAPSVAITVERVVGWGMLEERE